MGTTNLDRLELGGVEITPPITEAVTKTVGVGKDFTDINDALDWASNASVVGLGSITLMIDDGDHELKGTNLYSISGNVTLRGAAGVSADCNICLPADYDNSFGNMLNVSASGILTTFFIIIDPKKAGAADTSHVSGVLVSGGKYSSAYTTISNCRYGIQLNTGGVFDGNVMTITNSVNSGFTATARTSAYILDSVFTNNAVAVEATQGGIVSLSSPTFTTNTSDTNIPLNEIQYDGGYISDGTAALTLKA